MRINKYSLFVTGLITLTFTLTIFVAISQVNARACDTITEVQYSFINPAEIEANLIAETIKSYNPQLNQDLQRAISNAIKDESSQTGFDPLFISSVIAAESSFEPEAVSPCAARGLMQLTDEVSEIMNISNPFDVKQNIYAGTRYLQCLRQQFDDPALILAAYNAGPTRVAKLGRIPKISETINYIKKVNSVHQFLKDKFYTSLKDEIEKTSFMPQELTFNWGLFKNNRIFQNFFRNTDEIISCESKPYSFYSWTIT